MCAVSVRQRRGPGESFHLEHRTESRPQRVDHGGETSRSGHCEQREVFVPQPVEERAALFEINVRRAVANRGSVKLARRRRWRGNVLVGVGDARAVVHDFLGVAGIEHGLAALGDVLPVGHEDVVQ